MRNAPKKAVAEVLLFDWHTGKDKSGFLCGFYLSQEAAALAQSLIEYMHGNACYVRNRNSRKESV